MNFELITMPYRHVIKQYATRRAAERYYSWLHPLLFVTEEGVSVSCPGHFTSGGTELRRLNGKKNPAPSRNIILSSSLKLNTIPTEKSRLPSSLSVFQTYAKHSDLLSHFRKAVRQNTVQPATAVIVEGGGVSPPRSGGLL